MLEPLETRQLFAGVIQINTTGDYIVIRGDGESNSLRVNEIDSGGDGTPGGGVVFRSQDPIIVNGEPYSDGTYFLGVYNTKPWRVDLGAGDDFLDIIRYEDSIVSISAKLGAGNDAFSVDSHFYPENIGAVAIDGGDGEDRVLIGNVGGNVSIYPGAGRDRVTIKGDDEYAMNNPRLRAKIQGKLQIFDTQGPTRVEMSFVDVRKETSIITGNSIDRVNLNYCSFVRSVTVATRGGNDVITTATSRFRAYEYVLPGLGTDVVDGSVEWES